MTPREILGSFCEPVTVQGSVLEGPWREGTHAYASNRHWMVRMPAFGMGNLIGRTPAHPTTAVVAALFAAAPQTGFAPMETLPKVDPCPRCMGTLTVQTHACLSCAGTGKFTHYGCDYDCAPCEGSGRAWVEDSAAPADANEPCIDCSGTGFDLAQPHIALYGAQWFQPGYLHAIARLPGVTFASGSNKGPAGFRFDGGGEGVLMPCHPPRIAAGV